MSAQGRISSWSAIDSVGRIVLDDGEVVRFGATACPFPPQVGLAVRVSSLERHPLGGQRAVGVTLVAPNQGDELLDARDPLPGTHPSSAEEVHAFAELVKDVGLLGVVAREPIRSRAQLRGWFERVGATIDFANARCPLVRAGGVTFRVWLCSAPLGGGQAIISFALDEPYSIAKLRELAFAETSSMFSKLEGLTSLVHQLAEPEVGVILHQAGGAMIASPSWSKIAETSPLDAWLYFAPTAGGMARLIGFAGFRLPDLVLDAPLSSDSEALLREAACALIEIGTPPQAGQRLGRLTVADVERPGWAGVNPEEWLVLTEGR